LCLPSEPWVLPSSSALKILSAFTGNANRIFFGERIGWTLVNAL
jgi:hypothetical protein